MPFHRFLRRASVAAALALAPHALAQVASIQPDHEFKANNCEFFVNSLGQENRHYGGGGYDEKLVVAYLSVDTHDLVDTQGGKILQVGLRANGRDDVVTAYELEPSYYVLRKSIWLRGYNNADYDLRWLAFFVDVQRAGGAIDRLWLTQGEGDFAWPSVFSDYPQYFLSLGSGYTQYVQDPSPIYAQKHACGH
jgi:hypothetical protein